MDKNHKSRTFQRDIQPRRKDLFRSSSPQQVAGSLTSLRLQSETRRRSGSEKVRDKRPSWDAYFLNLIRTIGTRATCDRGRAGCVIVKDKRILATGYAGSPAGTKHCDDVGHEIHLVINEDNSRSRHCVRTAHAEQNAVANAARFGAALDGATLYCNMTPCYTCAKMIINAGIKRVICEKDYHAGERSKRIFKEAGLKYILMNHRTQKYDDM